MQTVQVTNVTVDELIDRLRNASQVVPVALESAPASGPSKINVLGRKDAAGTLNISTSFFDKLVARGILPPTVTAGYNKSGKPILRWAEHHLLAIKPVIVSLRHRQDEQSYTDARRRITKILGL